MGKLHSGDVIAADFKTKSGQLVVPAGAFVTEVLINALSDLSHATPLCEEVHIRRKVV